jgi:hypothetical protein
VTSSAADWAFCQGLNQSAHKNKKISARDKEVPSITHTELQLFTNNENTALICGTSRVWMSDNRALVLPIQHMHLVLLDVPVIWRYLHGISIHPNVGLVLADWAMHIVVTFLGSSSSELNILCSNIGMWHLPWIEIKIESQLCSVINIMINVTFCSAFYCD